MILTKFDQDKAPDAAQNMAILMHCKRLLHGGRVQVGLRSAGGVRIGAENVAFFHILFL